MKTTFAIACLLSAVLATPLQAREEQVDQAFFDGILNGVNPPDDQGAQGIAGQGSNIFSNIFDAGTCIISSFIGGGNPNCQGKGEASAMPPPSSDGSSKPATHYTYNYTTNKDGLLEVDVTLDNGHKCHYEIDADGKDVKTEITKQANKCIAEGTK